MSFILKKKRKHFSSWFHKYQSFFNNYMYIIRQNSIKCWRNLQNSKWALSCVLLYECDQCTYVYSSIVDTILFMVPASLVKNIYHRMWQSNGKAFKTEKGMEWSIWTILPSRGPSMELQVAMQKNWFILCYLFYSSFAAINLGVIVLNRTHRGNKYQGPWGRINAIQQKGIAIQHDFSR